MKQNRPFSACVNSVPSVVYASVFFNLLFSVLSVFGYLQMEFYDYNLSLFKGFKMVNFIHKESQILSCITVPFNNHKYFLQIKEALCVRLFS